jgi:hypothetical protein
MVVFNPHFADPIFQYIVQMCGSIEKCETVPLPSNIGRMLRFLAASVKEVSRQRGDNHFGVVLCSHEDRFKRGKQ